MQLKDILQLGLTKKEALVYQALIKHGPLSASEIAQRIGVVRTTVYDLTDKLIARGMANKTSRANAILFVPEDPILLFERHQFLASISKKLSEDFKNTHEKQKLKTKVTYFGGKEGLRSIFNKTLDYKNITVYQITSIQSMIDALGLQFMKRYITKRAQRKIKVKAINIPEGELDYGRYSYSSHTDKRYLREVRVGPKGFGFASMLMIYENNVAIVSTEEENFGFLVTSKEFANLLRGIFNVIWNISTPV